MPGLSRTGIRRAGSVLCCNDTNRATLKRVTLRRAGQVHTCCVNPGPLHVQISDGSIVLLPILAHKILLGSIPYDFACTAGTPLALTASVDSRLTLYGGLFPIYGIFILPTVPVVSALWTTYTPDIEISADPFDFDWHTYPGAGSIANPLGPMFVIFAVKTAVVPPFGEDPPPPTESDYDYRNFFVDGP